MVTFTGSVSLEDAPEVVTLAVTDGAGTTVDYTTTTLSDKTFTVQEDILPGDYSVVASAPATSVYEAAESTVVDFTAPLLAREITVSVTV